MKSLSRQLANVDRIKSSTLSDEPSFYAHQDDHWESIKESEFFNVLYSNQFIKDDEASSDQQTIYVRKTTRSKAA